MCKKIFFATVTMLLTATLLLSTVYIPTSAKSNSQIRNEINSLEKESQKLEAEIAELKKDKAAQNAIKAKLDKQMAITQQEITACTNLINSYKAEIKKAKDKIAQKEKEIDDTKYLFRQRVRSLYMSGSTNNELMVLLDSDSFSDYLSLSEVSKSVAAHDKKMVNEITDAIAEINESQKEINKKMAAQNEIKKTLASKQAKLKSQQSEVNGVIANINKNQSKLEKENKEYEKAIDRLENEIQAALGGASSSGSNPVFTSATFTWPCPGFYNITSYYGSRWGRLHGGIDIASAGIYGKPIVAAAAGTVIAAGYNSGGYGYWVMINHGTNGGKQYATVYGHMCRAPSVSNGQKVRAGQTIGYVGSTGNSTGNHLHFEIRVNGSRVNPLNYFNKIK